MLRNSTPVNPKAKICGIIVSPEEGTGMGTGGQDVSLSSEEGVGNNIRPEHLH